jgi:trk system potassium uptake protein TrkA
MKVLVLGAGEVGYHTALRLSREGQHVVLVDRDNQALRKVNDSMDVQTLLGEASSPRILREAGIDQVDLVVAVTDSDEVNLQACRFARLLAPAATRVARIRNIDYLEFIEDAGQATLDVDVVINPEREVANQIIEFLAIPAASSVTDFAEGQVKLLGLRLPATSPLVGKDMAQVRPSGGLPFLVVAIERAGQVIIPRGEDHLRTNDLAYVVVSENAITDVVAHFGLSNEPVRNLVVVGGGAIGSAVAQEARKRGIKSRIVEKNQDRCEVLVDSLKDVLVLNGDGTDLTLLEEENVGAADVFAAMTQDEESNVLMALLGKKLGAKRTIARVAHLGYVPMVSTLGLELVVSPRFAAVSAILRYLRKGKVLNVASLRDEGAEVIEVEAMPTSGVVGKPLADVKMPSGALVAAVIRGSNVMIPSGTTVVEPGDHLLIFLLRQVLGKVEKLLTVSLEFF